jgi:hypothetical protein
MSLKTLPRAASKGFLAERTPKYSFLDGAKTIFFLKKNMVFAPSLEFYFPLRNAN